MQWLIDKWEAGHMTTTPYWAWRREHAESHCCLSVRGRSSISTFPALLLYLLNLPIQILTIFSTFHVMSWGSLPLNLHTHHTLGRGGLAKLYPSFKSQFLYHLSWENLSSLSSFSLIPNLNWMPLLWASMISFLLTGWSVESIFSISSGKDNDWSPQQTECSLTVGWTEIPPPFRTPAPKAGCLLRATVFVPKPIHTSCTCECDSVI